MIYSAVKEIPMAPRLREKLIHNLNWIVTARWILILGFLGIALVRRVFVGAITEVSDPALTVVTAFLFLMNVAYLYLLRQSQRLSDADLRIISLLQVVVDQIVFTVLIYVTGGHESSLTLLYIFPLFITSALYASRSIMLLTLFNVVLYVGIVSGEFFGFLSTIFIFGRENTNIHTTQTFISSTLSVTAVLMMGGVFATFISAMVRDREREIIQESDRMNVILDRLSDAVIMVDNYNRIAIINKQGERLTKRGRSFLIGRVLSAEIFPVQFYTLGLTVARMMATEKMIIEEVTIPIGDKAKIFQVTVVPVLDSYGGFHGCIKLISDMTKEKELERIKSNFVSVAAHQLRTPLSGVKWMLHMLLKGDLGPLTPEQRRFIERGYHNHERMIQLVTELLDISKIEDGRMEFHFEAEGLEGVIQEALKLIGDVAEKKDVSIKFSKPLFALPAVKIDREKIAIVLQNILDNALKYTPKAGQVTVTLKRKGADIVTTIEDNGIGIPQDQQSKIFTKFYRASNAISQNAEGTGLGLFIVQQIIKNHEGDIGVTSQEGKGTKIWVTLPIA